MTDRLGLLGIALLAVFVLWVESLPMVPEIGSGEVGLHRRSGEISHLAKTVQGMSAGNVRGQRPFVSPCPFGSRGASTLINLPEPARATPSRGTGRQDRPRVEQGNWQPIVPVGLSPDGALYLLRPVLGSLVEPELFTSEGEAHSFEVAAGWGAEEQSQGTTLIYGGAIPPVLPPDSLPDATTRTTEALGPSDRSGPGRRAMTVRVTYYVDRGTTRWNCAAGPGIVASDPAVIPPMSIVLLDGDEYLVCDTGDFTGAWIDVWVPSIQAGRDLAARFGKYVEVEILEVRE